MFCSAVAAVAEIARYTATAGRTTDTDGTARPFPVDGSIKPSVAALVAAVEIELGPVDVLGNNITMFASLVPGSFTDVEEGEWDRVMAANAQGPIPVRPGRRAQHGATGSGKIACGAVFKGTPGVLHDVTSTGLWPQ